MGDRLRAGVPSRYVSSQLGQLSLASFRVRLIEYQLQLGYPGKGRNVVVPGRAFQFAIRFDSIRYANRFESIRFVKNRPFDSLVVMQFLH